MAGPTGFISRGKKDMNIKVFYSLNETLKPIWVELEKKVEPFVFQRWNWILHWQRTLGVANRTRPCVVVIEDDEQPVGLLPLGITNKSGVKVLSPLGSDQNDYNVPLLTELGKKLYLKPECWEEIDRHLPVYDVISWDKVIEKEILLAHVNVSGGLVKAINAAYSMDLPNSWELFEKKQLPRRTDSRRKRKKIREIGDLEFEVVDIESAEYPELYLNFKKHKRERYLLTGAKDIFKIDGIEDFYGSINQYISEECFIHFCVLKVNDVVLATHLGAFDKNTFYWLMPAFNQEWSSYSPGRLLLEHLVEWSITKGLKVFDFTIGGEEYKKEWCNHETMLYGLIQSRTLKGQIYVQLLELKNKLKDAEYLANAYYFLRKFRHDTAGSLMGR
jgi:CelD/BcsL family acetyltransferase involved in cellulose biosynthesis